MSDKELRQALAELKERNRKQDDDIIDMREAIRRRDSEIAALREAVRYAYANYMDLEQGEAEEWLERAEVRRALEEKV